MFTPTHGIMHHNITMTFQHWFIAAYMCCMLGMSTATAAPLEGVAHALGKGDYAQAIKILRPLAAQGNADAQTSLGSMYRIGWGVTQDYQEAAKWYRQAAAQGNADAQFGLGWMYYYGNGVTQDDQEALKWLRQAAVQGNELSKEMLKLPKMVVAAQDPGVGTATAAPTPIDDARAASNKGDYAQAVKIWRLLAAQGNAEAQTWLGVMYHQGLGVTQDYQEAAKWFRLAAEQGDVGAQFSLGEMYYDGKGVTQDLQKSLKWWRLAAAQGNEFAKEVLKKPEMIAVAQSLGTGWIYVGIAKTVTTYADPATIRRVGNKVKMWSLIDYKTSQTNAGEQYRSKKNQYEYDCKEEQFRLLFASDHSGNMGGGEVVMILHTPSEWIPVPPGSIGEELLKLACGKR